MKALNDRIMEYYAIVVLGTHAPRGYNRAWVARSSLEVERMLVPGIDRVADAVGIEARGQHHVVGVGAIAEEMNGKPQAKVEL